MSLLRVLAIPLWLFLEITGRATAGLCVMLIMTASDMVDGPLARRLGTAGARGAAIDAFCDAAVVFSAAVYFSLRDPRAIALAVMIVLALTAWRMHVRVGCAYTVLGRFCGTACYAYVLSAVVGRAIPAVAVIERILVWCVLGYLCLSVIENVIGIVRKKKHPPRDVEITRVLPII